jgi:hypothetical protein
MHRGPQLLHEARAADDLPAGLVPDAAGHHISAASAAFAAPATAASPTLTPSAGTLRPAVCGHQAMWR